MTSDTAHAYPPLADVRNSLHVRWYRCPIDPTRLRNLSQRDDKKGWIQAGGHFLIYLFFGALVILFWAQAQWLAFTVTLWCLGFVATYFAGTAPHELGHGTVFKTRYLNRVFLYLFSLISWWDPFDYASSHTYHHRYTTHPEADRENVLPLEPSLHPLLLLRLMTINLWSKPARNFSKGGFFWTVYLTVRAAFGWPQRHMDIPSQEWLQALHTDQPHAHRQSVWWSRILLAFHGSVFLIAIITGFWVLPLVLTLPSFIAGIGSYLTGVPQHCGLRENVTDFRKNTRSMKINPVLSFLYWRMNWHTEHHMYANVPCYNLKALADEIKHDMPEPRTLIGAWREMRQIWRRQQQDPDYQYDTPVPAPSKNASPVADSKLVSSLGELAIKE